MISTARLPRARNARPWHVAIVATLLLACALPQAALAKKSDRQKTVEVSARSADASATPNGVSHLKGDVVITQGSLKATSTNATIHFDAHSEVSRVVLTGAPAHLQQIDDNGNLVKAHANRIDYNVPKGIATLTGDAYVKQAGRGTATGDTLVYNTATSKMTAHSKGDNRVHLTFKPRQEASAPASTTETPAPAGTTPAPAPAASTDGN